MVARPVSAVDSPVGDDWDAIAPLRLRLHQHILVHPQSYRGERWYVLRDSASGRFLRFNAPAWTIIGRLDGVQSMGEIHQAALEEQADASLDKVDVVNIVTQLMALDALAGGMSGDTRAQLRKKRDAARARFIARFANPLALRLPLFDPDALLTRLLPYVRGIFSVPCALAFIFLLATASFFAVTGAAQLGVGIKELSWSVRGLLLIWILYPLIKTLHELAHGLAVKMWGGDVHEMGVTFLVLMPVPYVDASGSWAFRSKYKRALVGAAGILVELAVAALAILLWFFIEPGWIRDAALQTALIGSVSTLLINGNPLLRFDGYYVLQDLVEIPNLYSRASRYYVYLCKKYLLRLNVPSPACANGERRWFLAYGAAAFAYRCVLLVVIVFFLAQKLLFLGVALGAFAAFNQLVRPAWRAGAYLVTSHELAAARPRAVATTLALLAATAAALMWLPVPLHTRAQGIVTVHDSLHVTARTPGFVEKRFVDSGTPVVRDQPLLQLSNETLATRLRVVAASLNELEAKKASSAGISLFKARMVDDELVSVRAEYDSLSLQSASLVVRAPRDGLWVMPTADRIDGRHVSQGDTLGYVMRRDSMVVRTLVAQGDIGMLRGYPTNARVRLAERLDADFGSEILREVPMADRSLPSAALGSRGGGAIEIDPLDDKGITASQEFFEVDLSLPPEAVPSGIGGRAYVRFDHGSEPLARQWGRRARQLVLRRLSF